MSPIPTARSQLLYLLAVTLARPVGAQGAPISPDYVLQRPLGCETSLGANRSLPADTVPSIFTRLVIASPIRRACVVEPSFTSGASRNQVRFQQLGSLEGARFLIYESDGSGAIQGVAGDTSLTIEGAWELQCDIDKMDDQVRCLLNRGDLFIGRDRAGHSIAIGHDHVPGSSIAIRVDRDPPSTASASVGFVGSAADSLLGRLRHGASVVTRFQIWPQGVNVDRTLGLYGASPAIALLDSVFISIRQPGTSKPDARRFSRWRR